MVRRAYRPSLVTRQLGYLLTENIVQTVAPLETVQ